jgi:predicted nucleotidyltransferase
VKPSVALEQKRDAVRATIAKYPTIANPRVFGSVLHGDDTESSDLDILVDALPGTSLFTLGGLQIELEDLLSVPVHIVLPTELPPRIRDRVIGEANPL